MIKFFLFNGYFFPQAIDGVDQGITCQGNASTLHQLGAQFALGKW